MQYSHYPSNAEVTQRSDPPFWEGAPTTHAGTLLHSSSGPLICPAPALHPTVADPRLLMQSTAPPYHLYGDGLPMSTSEPCPTVFPQDNTSRSLATDRLFTVSPPTPTSNFLPLPVFQHALVQGQLNGPEAVSHSQLQQGSSRDTPTPGNRKIYEDCRGNRQSYWSFVLDAVLTLQYIYGELSILATPPGDKKPKYKCGICNHPSTSQPTRDPTVTQRRWDLSPHILSHALVPIKSWFCDCDKSFVRSHDLNRHSKGCNSSNTADDLVNDSCVPQVAASSTPELLLTPRVNTTPCSAYDTTRGALPGLCAPVGDLDRPHGVNLWIPQTMQDVASTRPPVYRHDPDATFQREKVPTSFSGPVVAEKSGPGYDLEAFNTLPIRTCAYRMGSSEKFVAILSSLVLTAIVCYFYSHSGL